MPTLPPRAGCFAIAAPALHPMNDSAPGTRWYQVGTPVPDNPESLGQLVGGLIACSVDCWCNRRDRDPLHHFQVERFRAIDRTRPLAVLVLADVAEIATWLDFDCDI